MSDVNWAALVPLAVVAVALVVFCWVDIARGEVRRLPKWAWAVICFVSIPLGPMLYLMMGRMPRQRSYRR
jgi:hypothetical protein